MIRLEKISRIYQLGENSVYALREVTENIEAGDHVAIMGPSGSGKSTLLNLIGCLDRPSSGQYFLDGGEVSQLSLAELSLVRRHKIGFIFQSYHLIPRLDAAGNVELPMIFAGIPKSERRARSAELLESVGLRERMHHRPDQLSGGERQRVAIARALSMKPKILLADEPTGNLDSISGEQVLEILEQRNREGLTLLVVTHDPAVARRAKRVIVLKDGAIIRRLKASEVRSVSDLFAVKSEP